MIDHQLDGSDGSDRWLPLILGLISLAQRVEGMLATPLDVMSVPEAPGEPAAELALLLGLVKFRSTFEHGLDEANPPITAQLPRRERRALRGLLR